MLIRVLGRGGSSSRMIRRISSKAALRAGACLSKRRRAGEQLVEQHAERIDVAAGIDVEAVHLGLLGAHVERRADHLAEAGVERLLGELLAEWPWRRRSRSPWAPAGRRAA